MKNFKKVSNYSIAGLLAVGVILLSFFAYREKILADTIVPGYATAHVYIHVVVPTVEAVPFKVTFLPQTSSPRYYYKERSFMLASGMNTIEWYIRKIPSGSYQVKVESNGKEITGSPFAADLVNDKVNETTSFELNIGEPTPSPVPSVASDPNQADPGYDSLDSGGASGDETISPEPADSIASGDTPETPADPTSLI